MACTVDEYETANPNRKREDALQLTNLDRINMLLLNDTGITMRDIARYVGACDKIQYERMKSIRSFQQGRGIMNPLFTTSAES